MANRSLFLYILCLVPIIVAINKIDKTNADVDRTKSMLLQEGIQLEDIGGDVQSVSISALKGTNIPVLLDTVLLQVINNPSIILCHQISAFFMLYYIICLYIGRIP